MRHGNKCRQTESDENTETRSAAEDIKDWIRAIGGGGALITKDRGKGLNCHRQCSIYEEAYATDEQTGQLLIFGLLFREI